MLADSSATRPIPLKSCAWFAGNNFVDLLTKMLHIHSVKSAEFLKWLGKQGCTFKPGRGGHLKVYLNGRKSVIPMHGANKELGTGLVNSIKKDLGLK